jgi:hypothetical protein
MSELSQVQPKNLVMGFATNLAEASLRIFCQSLRTLYTPEECDIIVLTNRVETYFGELEKIGVSFEPTPNNYSSRTSRSTKAANRTILHFFRLLNVFSKLKWFPEIVEAYPLLIETWHHPQLARWFAYSRILRFNRMYKQIFLADVKDVVFQSQFFGVADGEKVTLFEDANRYGDCYWNDKWYKEGYGENAFAKVIGRHPICVGTLLGTFDAMLGLLDEFTRCLARSPFGRIEQAIFNNMLCAGMFTANLERAPNVDGAVATLGSKAAYEKVIVEDGAIRRTSDRSVIPVVHMYDRWAETAKFCSNRHLTFSDGLGSARLYAR